MQEKHSNKGVLTLVSIPLNAENPLPVNATVAGVFWRHLAVVDIGPLDVIEHLAV